MTRRHVGAHQRVAGGESVLLAAFFARGGIVSQLEYDATLTGPTALPRRVAIDERIRWHIARYD